MTVFVSHSLQDTAQFENVTQWLDLHKVPYWRPADLKSGESLRDQLRASIRSCSVCVFIATHTSVTSSWCGAELGAFWGAGIPVITYMADASLTEDALPVILRGDVHTAKLSEVATRAAELVRSRPPGGRGPASDDRVGMMTVAQLEKVVASSVLLLMATRDQGVATAGSHPGPEAMTSVAQATESIIRAVDAATEVVERTDDAWRSRVLWVDDRPGNIVRERRVFESLGVTFELAQSTNEALNSLRRNRFGAIISNMSRPEGPRDGYRLLDAVRTGDRTTPFFIYSGECDHQSQWEAMERGAQGYTNVADQLVIAVMDALRPPRHD